MSNKVGSIYQAPTTQPPSQHWPPPTNPAYRENSKLEESKRPSAPPAKFADAPDKRLADMKVSENRPARKPSTEERPFILDPRYPFKAPDKKSERREEVDFLTGTPPRDAELLADAPGAGSDVAAPFPDEDGADSQPGLDPSAPRPRAGESSSTTDTKSTVQGQVNHLIDSVHEVLVAPHAKLAERTGRLTEVTQKLVSLKNDGIIDAQSLSNAVADLGTLIAHIPAGSSPEDKLALAKAVRNADPTPSADRAHYLGSLVEALSPLGKDLDAWVDEALTHNVANESGKFKAERIITWIQARDSWPHTCLRRALDLVARHDRKQLAHLATAIGHRHDKHTVTMFLPYLALPGASGTPGIPGGKTLAGLVLSIGKHFTPSLAQALVEGYQALCLSVERNPPPRPEDVLKAILVADQADSKSPSLNVPPETTAWAQKALAKTDAKGA